MKHLSRKNNLFLAVLFFSLVAAFQNCSAPNSTMNSTSVLSQSQSIASGTTVDTSMGGSSGTGSTPSGTPSCVATLVSVDASGVSSWHIDMQNLSTPDSGAAREILLLMQVNNTTLPLLSSEGVLASSNVALDSTQTSGTVDFTLNDANLSLAAGTYPVKFQAIDNLGTTVSAILCATSAVNLVIQ